ncbi:insulin-like growth factor-binding protein 3 isoform X2 [Kryptolebias marmoratus]|uniref:insulin-like growth factor-binding protein 3 isoform X2 n=1 Tax=Kryptolebias marmoratus TaxID=37003 RepID=UPI0018ACC3E9|nr:insulin-like growth factor-binding protein 3 isoform X2 [Kryptolebias marmoratus]
MGSSLVALCLCAAFLAASLGRRSGAVGAVIRCEPCDAAARLLCKPLPRDCAERVREPGCGCCLTCALSFGQPCGVYTGRCGSGLTCQAQPGETKPLQALIEGRGICVNATNRRAAVRPTPPVNELPEHTETLDKEQNSTDSSLQTSYNSHAGPLRPPHHPSFSSAKSDVLRREPQKKTQSFKMEDLPGPLITDQQNFALETKQEPEYGPCRREIESILSNLKITNILNPRGFRIPNCDKKGFYKKKQLLKLRHCTTPVRQTLATGSGNRNHRGQTPAALTAGTTAALPPLPGRQTSSAVHPRAGSEASAGVWTNTGSPCQGLTRRSKATSSTTTPTASRTEEEREGLREAASGQEEL